MSDALPEVGDRFIHSISGAVREFRGFSKPRNHVSYYIEGDNDGCSLEEWNEWAANATRLEDKMTKWERLRQQMQESRKATSDISKHLVVNGKNGKVLVDWEADREPLATPRVRIFENNGPDCRKSIVIYGDDDLLAIRDSITDMLEGE